MAESLVAILIHYSRQDLQKAMKDTHTTGIVEDTIQQLQQKDCQKLVKIWNSLVEDFETSSLVKSLIQSGQGGSGKMEIIRAKNREAANQF